MRHANPQKILRSHRDQILETARRYGVRRVRVVRSVAHGSSDELSEFDLLVELYPGRSVNDLGGMLHELKQMLGVEVDIVTENGLRPRIRERVLSEATEL